MSKILIIEDDEVVANIYRSRFSSEGFEVEVAADGHAGLESIQSLRPDAVILDLMLPKLSGVDLMKKVRAQPEFEHLPIIVFSNTYLTTMVQEAWKAGATKCLSKASCSPKHLVNVVRTTLVKNLPAKTAEVSPASVEPVLASTPEVVPVPSAETEEQTQPAEQTEVAEPDSPTELKSAFFDSAPEALAVLRTHLQACTKASADQVRLRHLDQMYSRVHGLTSTAGVAGLGCIAQLSDALEALLKELHRKPSTINASTLRTVASAVDLLGVLLERGQDWEAQDSPPANILVVDDEAISRRAITYALEKARLKAVSVENPQIAYDLICENSFDLVFLDVDMPDINGYELCAKLRTLPGYKATPVVFVTGLNDFEARANSMISGGNDFIAKPFLFIELAVKALVYVLRNRLQQAKVPSRGSTDF
jgi:DNA-binding response OmpR family regulator